MQGTIKPVHVLDDQRICAITKPTESLQYAATDVEMPQCKTARRVPAGCQMACSTLWFRSVIGFANDLLPEHKLAAL